MTETRTLERASQGLGQRPALIIVDVINGFTDPNCPLGSDADSVVAANCTLLDRFHAQQLPVYVTTVVYHNDSDASVFRDRLPALNVLSAGSHWVEFDSRLQLSESDQRIEKTHASAFHGTHLDERLKERNVDSLVVTGLTTSGCVRATAVDGLQYNYKVVVPREATGDRNQAAHEANLFDLNAKYADVMSLENVLLLLDAIT
jgi:nicotinamidase-related amidase